MKISLCEILGEVPLDHREKLADVYYAYYDGMFEVIKNKMQTQYHADKYIIQKIKKDYNLSIKYVPEKYV